MAITEVARDPFARQSLLRQSEATSETRESCSWCGQQPRTLYRYSIDPDSVRRLPPHWSEPFCNLGCYRTYHS